MLSKNSELHMANSFQEYLLTKKPNSLPLFGTLVREFASRQGIPDFVGIEGEKLCFEYAELLDRAYKALGISALSLISLCSESRGRSPDYFIGRLSIDSCRLMRTLHRLVQLEVLSQTVGGTYRLTLSPPQDKNEIWSFELKLHDWRRALFQAAQSKSFANKVVVVFPFLKRKLIEQHLGLFKRHGIGAMLFDSETQQASFLAKPRPSRPSSSGYALHAYLRLASMAAN